jgi:hypothetical protein
MVFVSAAMMKMALTNEYAAPVQVIDFATMKFVVPVIVFILTIMRIVVSAMVAIASTKSFFLSIVISVLSATAFVIEKKALMNKAMVRKPKIMLGVPETIAFAADTAAAVVHANQMQA